MAAAPTRAKKRLGKFLTELRLARSRDQADVAGELRVSRVSLSRYELGQVLPPWAVIHLLLRVLGVSDDERAEALTRWEMANDEPASVRLPVDAPKAFRTLINAEREAASMRCMSLSVIHGLLQTERYARALFDSAHRFHRPDANPVSVVNARLQRQQRLESSKNPLKLHVLLDQAVLERAVGGPEVMREQCEHLLTASGRPNITLQVVPFGVGAYGPMGGPCVIVDYPDPDDAPGVYLEFLTGGDWVDNRVDVQRFVAMFDDVASVALSPSDTSDLVRDRLKALGDR
jgi:transcriptional regulator with XRE-family HTH domain